MPDEAALIRRAAAELLFTIRIFAAVLRSGRRGDVVLTVTAPFMPPYTVALVAKLRGAKSALITHDLYPDVLVMAVLLKPASRVAQAIRAANFLMFSMLSAVITIGRDSERLLLRHRSLRRDMIRFIPNWATLAPQVRPARLNSISPRWLPRVGDLRSRWTRG